jgi:hypothetical protein
MGMSRKAYAGKLKRHRANNPKKLKSWVKGH